MAQDFITQFHTIQGETIGERQRNLNTFLKNVPIIPEQKEFILNNLHPTTYLEKLFYIDVLIYLKETSRLLEIFKDGNGAYVCKIMKQPWFFQEAFNNVTPKTLVDDFLPLLSFTTKVKLLRSLPHIYTEEKIDEVFDHVVNKYGLFMTDPFITACSSEKIAAVLKNYKIKLATHQLKIIYRKEPNLINIYLEEQIRYTKKNIFDNNFLMYLAKSNPVYVFELIEKYKINQDKRLLGRRSTKKVLSTKTQQIINDPEKYIKYLRQETLVRKLNQQGHFKQLYYNLFPTKTEVLESGDALCNTLLKYYPKSDQYNLFTKTFNGIIKEDIWNYTNCIHDSLLRTLTDTKQREAWGQLKYTESSNEEYIKFYEIQKAFTLIKDKIKTTASVQKRGKLMSLLVKSCGISKDLKTLEELLQYFCVRHKNDDKTIRSQFLREIENNFDLKQLTPMHWKYISEILTVKSMNREYDFCHASFRMRHIEYLFNNNGSDEDKSYFILEYITEQSEKFNMNFEALDIVNNPDIQKTILLKTVEHIDVLANKHQDYNKYYVKSQLVGKILWFNVTHPNHSINIEEIEMLVSYIRGLSSNVGQFVSYIFQLYFPRVICKLNRSDFENELLKVYFKDVSMRQFSLEKTINWYLKHDPMVIVNNFDSIMEGWPPKTYRIWTTIKQYNHLLLDEITVKHCRHLLEQGDNDQKSLFVQPLSILENPDSYMKIIEDINVIPTSSKITVNDPEVRKLYQVQRALLKSFPNIWDPSKYLSLLIDKFCQGDYLRESLTPLNIAFHKTPEHKLEIYLDKLAANKAMSVKKHALFLASYMFEQRKVLQIFNNFQEDKNESLQRCLCLTSLRYFTKMQTREHFEKLLSYFKYLKEEDTESLEILSSVQIPKNYKPCYITNLWNLLEKLKANPDAIGLNKQMAAVLDNVDAECVSNLSEEFCKHIINQYFGTTLEKEDEIHNILQFVIKFLMHHENQTDNFTYIFQLLSNYKSQFWDLNGKERNMIHKFFNEFYKTVPEETTDLEFVNKFSTEWRKLFTDRETFQEHVLLRFSIFNKDAKGDVELYSKHIVHFAEQVSAKYGEFIFAKFIPIITEFCLFGNKEKEMIELLTAILRYKASTLNCMLVMELIKSDLFNKNGVRVMYHEIDSILRQVTDSKVRLCYNMYSQNLCT